jgi:hypothetical protein
MVRQAHRSVWLRLLVVGSLAAWTGLSPATARANHTEKDRQTEVSAFTLQAQQAKLGLFKLEYGILDRWMVSTYTLPWILMPILQGPVINLGTKVRLLDLGDLHLAGKLSFFYANIHGIDASSVEDGSFRGTIIPIVAQGSYVFSKRWTASGELTWVQTIAHGDAESPSESSVGGALGQSSFQTALSGEYRFDKHAALNLLVRFAPYVQPLQLTTDADVGTDTAVVLQAEVESDNQNAFLIQAGMTFSWGIWNLRAGVGYGNLFIPGPQLVTAVRTVIPDLDFYARF